MANISPIDTNLEAHDSVEIEQNQEAYEVGQWYWVSRKSDKHEKWLVCVMAVGSNYVELRGPDTGRSSWHSRIHFEDACTRLRRETNATQAIRGKVAHYQARVQKNLATAQALTARLGVSPLPALTTAASADAGRALAVLSGQNDIKQYESALILAKDKTLPDIFKAIREDNETMAAWMAAETLPLQAATDTMKQSIKVIEDRVFNVSLYAGLTENVVMCADGNPAHASERLRVMQRKLYMDEESLLGYRHGGMDFDDITKFDAWLVEPENRDRILPFPRCITAMQVRRRQKNREDDGSLRTMLINIELGALDKATFLYIRNGEQVSRLSCDLDFDELIFPPRAVFEGGEPLMIETFAGRIDGFMSRAEYEDRLREQNEQERKRKEWEMANPEKQWESQNKGSYRFANPYWNDVFRDHARYEPFDPSSVYYDDGVAAVADEVKKYNRIALVVQGLFDRSDVLHPHSPVHMWTPEGFASAVELIYDGAANLYHGDAPDFEAYRARLNESLDNESIVVGQEIVWEEIEAEKESRRMDNSRFVQSEWRPERFRPTGNPGPGAVARVAAWQPKVRKAVFAWHRERRGRDEYFAPKPSLIRTTLTVPADRLLNVSAYQPGDFKQFFRDPRTRAQYLKWAPMLLLAEEYHAGNISATEPVESEE